LNSFTTVDTSYNRYGNNAIGLASASITNGQITDASFYLQNNAVISPNANSSTTFQGGGMIDFTDNSSNNPTSWLWNFGDGNTSTQQNPAHTYTSTGIYTICLTVTDSAGSDMVCMNVEVSFAPIAAFSSVDQGGGVIDFTDNSSNDPTSWVWDFGDGNTSNLQNPQYTYASADTYNVCLTVVNSAGSDVTCMNTPVTITVVPSAAFSFMGENTGTVDFTDNSANSPTSWAWDFGDGNTSTDQNPQHTYTTTEMYSVCLTVTNGAGSNTICETINVIISSTDNPEKIVNIELFPNPVYDILNIRLENNQTETLNFQLIDALGRTVKELQVETNGTYQLDLKKLDMGMYYYILMDQAGKIRSKESLIKI